MPKTVAASRRHCWSYRLCEGKWGVSVDAPRLTEHDSMNERQRGTRDSPEFAGAVVGAAAESRESWTAWWREGKIVWGKMVVGRWGSYSPRLDK